MFAGFLLLKWLVLYLKLHLENNFKIIIEIFGYYFTLFYLCNKKLNDKKMKNFFHGEDRFCVNLYDLADVLCIDKDNVNKFADDFCVKVELSTLEPIFKVDADSICQLLADANEDRLSEDEFEGENVLKALKESIDFEKLNNLLPKKYYPNGQFAYVTKADLIDIF